MAGLRLFAGACLAALAVAYAGQATAQNYPVKPVRLVSAAAGAGSDFVARTVATGLTESWGQPVTVDNRGGSAVIPIEVAAKAPPDGYTLLVFGSALWHLPFMQNVSYDPIRDFAPIILAATTPLVVIVHPSLPVKSIKDLVALAKRRPGQLNYSSGIAGSTTHLPVELFKSMAGVDLVRVSYKGGAPALIALLSGETQVMIANANNITSLVGTGKFRELAVTTAQRSALFPNLPTVAEAGVPGYEASSLQCLFAPAGTPAAIINRINRDVTTVLSKSDVKARFFKGGVEFTAISPEAFAAVIKADMAAMGKVIKAAGIRGD
jgi:tripartite-type tricarboxylate transporter receptor subunit TctC